MLNYIWLALIALAVLIGGYNTFNGAETGTFSQMTSGGFDMAKFAVMNLALPLAGIMALWLGMMRLAERAGLVQMIARFLRPLLRRLFPDVPVEHPAMGSMVMNIAANMLGLSNAATPLGLRAMKDLETLNRHTGTATNAMCTFLVINTSSVQLLPVTAVGVLAVNGSANPSAIIGTAFLATLCSTIVGVTAVKLLGKLRVYRLPAAPAVATAASQQAAGDDAEPLSTAESAAGPLRWWGRALLTLFFLFFAGLFFAFAFPGWFGREMIAEASDARPVVRSVQAISLLAIPFVLSFFPVYAVLRRIKVYEEFVEGAKEGFQVAVRIVPYLVAILVAIGLFRGAGGIELLTNVLRPALDWVGFPPDLLPMALMRPLSGSGSLGVFTDLVKEFGADSFIARAAGTIYGSTETTFYVLAVYFGSVGIRRTRHAVPAGLLADVTGIIAAVVIARMMFG